MSITNGKLSNATKLVTVSGNELDFDTTNEILSDIKLWLIIVVIIIIKLILIKFVKACKRAYDVHNDSVSKTSQFDLSLPLQTISYFSKF